MLGVAIAVLVLVGLLLVFRQALVSYSPADDVSVVIGGDCSSAAAAPDQLEILTWNTGYAGLGRDSDFIADGGRRLRAPSRTTVADNLAAIEDQLHREDADIFLLQELSHDSYLTHGVDVLAAVSTGLDVPCFAFTPTVRTKPLPIIGGLTVGKATASRFGVSEARRQALATSSDFAGITLQHYNVLTTRIPAADGGRDWVLLNIHLAAFDDGELRRNQLAAVVDLMKAEYAAGHRVVAGGDWNLILSDSEFPYTTPEKNKFWVRPMPPGVVPDDWQWAADPDTPTCRTLEQPYQAGVNYTCIIDGFLVTPNVEILEVETRDLGFENSDHNPVRVLVRGR